MRHTSHPEAFQYFFFFFSKRNRVHCHRQADRYESDGIMTEGSADTLLDDGNASSLAGSSLVPVDLPSPLSSIGSDDDGQIALLEQDDSSLNDDNPKSWIFDELDGRHLETVKVAWKQVSFSGKLHLQGVEMNMECVDYLVQASINDSLSSFQSLILEKCSFISKSSEQAFLREFLVKHCAPSLQELSYIPVRNLPPSKRFVDPFLGQLLPTLVQFTRLQGLYWEGCNFATLDKPILEDTSPMIMISRSFQSIEFRHCLLDAFIVQAFGRSFCRKAVFYSCNLQGGEVMSVVEQAMTRTQSCVQTRTLSPTEPIQRQDQSAPMQYLDLSFNALTIQSVPLLTRVLQSNPLIQTLKIGWNNNLLQVEATHSAQYEEQQQQDVHRFLQSLAEATRNLKALDLSRSGMSRKTLSFFVLTILRELKQLTRLDFCEHYQMDPQDWVQALPHMVSLQRWNLSRTVWQEWLLSHDTATESVKNSVDHPSLMNALSQNTTLVALGDEANLEIGSDHIQAITKRNMFLNRSRHLLSLKDFPLACTALAVQRFWCEMQPDSVYIFLKGRMAEI